VGRKTLHQKNPPVLNWRCRLTQVDLYNGRKTGGWNLVGWLIIATGQSAAVVSYDLSAAELYQGTAHFVHERGYPDSPVTLHYLGYCLHTYMQDCIEPSDHTSNFSCTPTNERLCILVCSQWSHTELRNTFPYNFVNFTATFHRFCIRNIVISIHSHHFVTS